MDTPHRSLSDLLQFPDGTLIASPNDWRRRRRDELSRIVDMQYGSLPPAPNTVHGCKLHSFTFATSTLSDIGYETYRILCGSDRDSPTFNLSLTIPPGQGAFPVVLCGDACWRNANDAVMIECVRRGYILALFNRTELAPDIAGGRQTFGLYSYHPEKAFGALSAWAWGYHRCVDFLQRHELVRSDQIAIVGHSRGGKAVLLAGATDERIALTAPNNSGLGGAGSYRFKGPNSETLTHCLQTFPHWFGPQMSAYRDREQELPFDQHILKAAIAPRSYISTEALDDLWANPSGTEKTHQAARRVWCFLNAEDRISIHFRKGGHSHGLPDWLVFLDFCDQQFQRTASIS